MSIFKSASPDLMDYASANFLCSCGRQHMTDIKQILTGDAILARLPGLVAEQKSRCGMQLEPGQDEILLVADQNTWAVGGPALLEILEPLGFKLKTQVFPGQPVLIPDEKAVFNILDALEPGTSLLLALGSGTLNDLVKFVSFKTRIPYYIIATAPSMDGYSSSGAPLIHNNLKMTFETATPAAIVADNQLMATCPTVMLSAGLGDVLGKFSAICDWRISALVNDEYYCPEIAKMVLDTVQDSLDAAYGLSVNEPAAVKQLFKSLLLTGIAMSYAGNSRPAGGSEHHLSHFWEMAFLSRGRAPVMHGSKVGLGTIITCALYQNLLHIQPDFAAARTRARLFDTAAWVAEIHRTYPGSAESIILLEREIGKNDPEKVILRLERIEKAWQDICQTISDTMPEPSVVARALKLTQGAVRPEELGIEPQLVDDAVRYAHDMRDRFTVLQLYADLGLLDMAVQVTRELFA